MNNTPETQLVRSLDMATAGALANRIASEHVFTRYHEECAARTQAAQRDDLARFAAYFAAAGVQAGNFYDNPSAWSGVTWGLVEGFKHWLATQGYAVATINRALSTVKKFAALALKAGTLDADNVHGIRAVTGHNFKTARNLDQNREQTRIGPKKAHHTPLTLAQARKLKKRPNTPQGRRDAFLICLLLDHGLRVSEAIDLRADAVNISEGTITFYRRKVKKTQSHKLTADTFRAAVAYVLNDAPKEGPMLRGSRKSKAGELQGGLSVRAAHERITYLGKQIGVEHLTPHDLRHYWATNAAKAGTDPLSLQEAGGWASLAMPRRYVAESKIANEGLKLDT